MKRSNRYQRDTTRPKREVPSTSSIISLIVYREVENLSSSGEAYRGITEEWTMRWPRSQVVATVVGTTQATKTLLEDKLQVQLQFDNLTKDVNYQVQTPAEIRKNAHALLDYLLDQELIEMNLQDYVTPKQSTSSSTTIDIKDEEDVKVKIEPEIQTLTQYGKAPNPNIIPRSSWKPQEESGFKDRASKIKSILEKVDGVVFKEDKTDTTSFIIDGDLQDILPQATTSAALGGTEANSQDIVPVVGGVELDQSSGSTSSTSSTQPSRRTARVPKSKTSTKQSGTSTSTATPINVTQ